MSPESASIERLVRLVERLNENADDRREIMVKLDRELKGEELAPFIAAMKQRRDELDTTGSPS